MTGMAGARAQPRRTTDAGATDPRRAAVDRGSRAERRRPDGRELRDQRGREPPSLPERPLPRPDALCCGRAGTSGEARGRGCAAARPRQRCRPGQAGNGVPFPARCGRSIRQGERSHRHPRALPRRPGLFHLPPACQLVLATRSRPRMPAHQIVTLGWRGLGCCVLHDPGHQRPCKQRVSPPEGGTREKCLHVTHSRLPLCSRATIVTRFGAARATSPGQAKPPPMTPRRGGSRTADPTGIPRHGPGGGRIGTSGPRPGGSASIAGVFFAPRWSRSAFPSRHLHQHAGNGVSMPWRTGLSATVPVAWRTPRTAK